MEISKLDLNKPPTVPCLILVDVPAITKDIVVAESLVTDSAIHKKNSPAAWKVRDGYYIAAYIGDKYIEQTEIIELLLPERE